MVFFDSGFGIAGFWASPRAMIMPKKQNPNNVRFMLVFSKNFDELPDLYIRMFYCISKFVLILNYKKSMSRSYLHYNMINIFQEVI